MQYVRSLGGSVSKTWNSINPATLSGAIDVIVVEQEDGSLACSPFHVRFGKFSLLRPSEKKVEFKVNNVKQSYSMKLGEGGEAFFVFETSANIPEALQTSPLVSPANSPPSMSSGQPPTPGLTEPSYLDIAEGGKRPTPEGSPLKFGTPTAIPTSTPSSEDFQSRSQGNRTPMLLPSSRLTPPLILERSVSEEALPSPEIPILIRRDVTAPAGTS